MQDDILEKRELLKRKFHQAQQTSVNQLEVTQQSHSNIDIVPEQHCWAGKSFSDLLFIEIYAGSARLSSAMRDQQFEVLAVDKTAERSSGFRIALLTSPMQTKQMNWRH